MSALQAKIPRLGENMGDYHVRKLLMKYSKLFKKKKIMYLDDF